jgi:hypothetical protein
VSIDEEIAPYVRLVLIKALTNTGWPEGFHRRDEFAAVLRSMTAPALEKFDPQVSSKIIDEALEQVLNEIIKEKALVATGDTFAGEYFQMRPPVLIRYRDAAWSNNSLSAVANAIGVDRFFSDVFAGFRARLNDADPSEMLETVAISDRVEGMIIPASDRFVTLGHNQQSELEDKTSELIKVLEKENSVDGDTSVRAWMLGQLKAARELIRAQVLNVWLLEQTVLTALGRLIEKYKGQAIGTAAKTLLELLIKHVFGA